MKYYTFTSRKLAANNKALSTEDGAVTRYELFTGNSNDAFMGVPIDSFYVEKIDYTNRSNEYTFGVVFRDGFYKNAVTSSVSSGVLKIRNGVRYTATITSSEYSSFAALTKKFGLEEFSAKHHPHIYNLWNQGWGEKRMEAANTTNLINPIDDFHVLAEKLPAAGDTVSSALYANSSNDSNRTADRFHPDDLIANPLGSSQAPAGRYVIDALDRGIGRRDAFLKDLKEKGSSRLSDYDMSFENTYKGATTVSSYAGRVWFAGFTQDSPGSTIPLSNKILYGQVSSDNTLNCYQSADPTAPEDYELVDTDGGYISIEGIDEVKELVATDTSLLVFASNGVWVIAGVDGNSFTPTSSLVTKITSKGAVNSQSIVQVDSDVFYWAEDGLYRLVSEGFATFKLEAITKSTINEIILDLRKEDFVGMSGAYDARTERLVWIIDGGEDDDSRRELVFNLSFGSFTVNTYYKEDIDGATKEILAIIDTPQFINSTGVDNVVAGEDNVVAGDDNVVVSTPIKTGNPSRIAYIGVETDASGMSSVFFANPVRQDFKDWGTVDAEAYLLTGYVSGGDTSREKQIPNLTLHFNRTETTATEEGVLGESSCLVQSQWEWTNDAYAGKWSNAFQGYRLPRPQIRGIDQPVAEGVKVVTTKNKLRGRGKTVSLKFSTEEGKDCQLLGWSMIAAANGNV
ncbi:hypothetical protein NVP1235O_17 [Vibrio phage 1.235.O._10N.261.52.B2]|nr:hypothetical protein NVP1235O_17 [Vibrio phage 1.235.O._10N.261.52.B2]